MISACDSRNEKDFVKRQREQGQGLGARSRERRLENRDQRAEQGITEPFKIGCTISLVSTGPQLVRPAAAPEHNWLPVAVAAVIVLAATGGMTIYFEHSKGAPSVTPISAATDPYAANLAIGGLAMSESSNLAGGKVTYLDGQISNKGSETVTGITVQVLFRDVAHEVAQNETQPMKIIRTRDPYIDVEPLSAAPLKPGATGDFRLIFDTVAEDWDGAYPEIRIIHVEGK